VPTFTTDTGSMIIVPTHSACSVEGSTIRVDRKFHTGMLRYAEAFDRELVVVAPARDDAGGHMDHIEVAASEAAYRLHMVECDGSHDPIEAERDGLTALVRGADLVYGCGFGLESMARANGVPFVAIVEYNRSTLAAIARLRPGGRVKRELRALMARLASLRESRTLRLADSVHCNGFPMFDQVSRYHPNCLLYLDSRVTDEMVVPEADLELRTASLRRGRRPRLIFSGRYEPMKGALDAVEVGLELHRRSLDFELVMYGRGADRDEMIRRVTRAGAEDRIRVHDAIPFPDLMALSRECDLFVCCHVQDDPSCTYLEASGCGLPIAGYGNRMWRGFAERAGNGVVTRLHDSVELADAVEGLLRSPERLSEMARRSRRFALDHCFEREFARRTDDVLRVLDRTPTRA